MFFRVADREILIGKFRKNVTAVCKEAAVIMYHIAVLGLSAGLALSLPVVAGFFAMEFPQYWFLIEQDHIFLVTLEVAVAILFIACLNYLRRSVEDRRLAGMADDAGFAYYFQTRRALTQRRIKKLKKKHGRARSILLIGSTGDRTFVDPKGDLHDILTNCLEAKIMLLNPYCEAAQSRARAICSPDISAENFREQVGKSVEFLKRLKAAQKSVRLKFYSGPPHIKLAILGDHIWLQHYHASRDVHGMPEYVFRHDYHDHGFYTMFYQYFIKRWECPDMPEYDFGTDELVYAESNGIVIRREPFGRETGRAADEDCAAAIQS